jgi:large subunit ribosomal protein L13
MVIVEKTYVIKGKAESNWLLVDATDENLGRLATRIAGYMLGKHKPNFTPGVAMGDHVVVINAEKLNFSQKRLENKPYYRLKDMLQKHPDRVIRRAVWGMLPHNKFGRSLMKNLKVYAGDEHPHGAHKPQPVE